MFEMQLREDESPNSASASMTRCEHPNGRDPNYRKSYKRNELKNLDDRCRAAQNSHPGAFVAIRPEPRRSEKCPARNAVPKVLAQLGSNIFHNRLPCSGNVIIRRFRGSGRGLTFLSFTERWLVWFPRREPILRRAPNSQNSLVPGPLVLRQLVFLFNIQSSRLRRRRRRESCPRRRARPGEERHDEIVRTDEAGTEGRSTTGTGPPN
jgi:hypothetical protein